MQANSKSTVSELPPQHEELPSHGNWEFCLEGLRVLVVDDSKELTTLLRSALERVGATVSESTSVKEAWNWLKTSEFDAVLCDIGMPVEDGLVLLRRIKESQNPLIRRLPVVALTAYRSLNEKNEFLVAGFAHHITKPFSLKELIDVLSEYKQE